MKVVVQRVSQARVDVGGVCVGKIDKGLMLLVGLGREDTIDDLQWMAQKVIHLRIFADNEDKMNRSVLDIGGKLLVISQFTLYGDCRKGRRPSFVDAMTPDLAEPLIEQFVAILKDYGLQIETGRFGAMMEVSLCNSGPVTLLIESPHKNSRSL
jgi:D-tyrosyl-tRNA(Tyr) deacylase